MQRVLDSSPVLMQPVPLVTKRSLKRTASLASLPTPPRTTHKHKRSRKDDSDFEEKFEISDSEPEAKPSGHKPNGQASRKSAKEADISEQAVEDAFWLGTNAKNQSSEKQKSKQKARPASTLGSAPVSPPPSRTNQVGPRFKTPPPLHERGVSPSSSAGTPIGQPDDSDGPIRDSPNNPFLVDSKEGSSLPPTKDEADDFDEPATVGYVFRGKRIEIMNPLYNLSPSAHEKSKLPPEHPEYSPSPTVKPRRLFAKELEMRSKVKAAAKRRRSPTPPSHSSSPSAPRTKRTGSSSRSKTKASPARSKSSPKSKGSPKKRRATSTRAS